MREACVRGCRRGGCGGCVVSSARADVWSPIAQVVRCRMPGVFRSRMGVREVVVVLLCLAHVVGHGAACPANAAAVDTSAAKQQRAGQCVQRRQHGAGKQPLLVLPHHLTGRHADAQPAPPSRTWEFYTQLSGVGSGLSGAGWQDAIFVSSSRSLPIMLQLQLICNEGSSRVAYLLGVTPKPGKNKFSMALRGHLGG